MNVKSRANRGGFTLVEILVVIAIIAILAAIILPLAGSAGKAAQRRRAQTEMQSIKVAILQFQADHHYMPWGDPALKTAAKVGEDKWTASESDQENVMKWLTGENPMTKVYLQIPEKSKKPGTQIFVEPWKDPLTNERLPYKIGMDRNMDGAVTVAETGVGKWDGKTVAEKVLVCSSIPPEKDEPLKTFDVVETP